MMSNQFRRGFVTAQYLDGIEPTQEEVLRGVHLVGTATSDAIVNALSYALSANYGPGHMPNEYGLAVERAIDAYLEAWPIYR